MKKIIKNPLTILVLGLIIVAGSSVGATRAAMGYSSAAENVDFETEKLLVDLQEDIEGNNGNYVSIGLTQSDSNNKNKVGKLNLTTVSKQITEDNKLKVNYDYDENVKIQNTSTGEYDEYVRVLVRKSWINSDGTKNTNLDPSVITLKTTSDWVEDTTEKTTEGSVYYYKKPLAVNGEVQFLDAISFEREILNGVTTTNVSQDGTIVKNVYGYDGKTFEIEIRVDAVQTHSGAEAILGAWGVDATIDASGNITSINGSN